MVVAGGKQPLLRVMEDGFVINLGVEEVADACLSRVERLAPTEIDCKGVKQLEGVSPRVGSIRLLGHESR